MNAIAHVGHLPKILQSRLPANESSLQLAKVVIVGILNENVEQSRLIAKARLSNRTSFIVCWNENATEDASMRWKAFEAGASMVTSCEESVIDAVRCADAQTFQGCLTCDWCGMKLLLDAHSELDLGGLPTASGIVSFNADRSACQVPSVYALAAVRRPSDGKFLLVQERGAEGYWLPGGGVDPGETLSQGAIRETIEEGGVHVKLLGLLAVEEHHGGTWKRVIFYAEPVDEAEKPKTLPNYESAGACWAHADELQNLVLRSPSELKFLPYLAQGGAWSPLQMPEKYKAAFEDWPL